MTQHRLHIVEALVLEGVIKRTRNQITVDPDNVPAQYAAVYSMLVATLKESKHQPLGSPGWGMQSRIDGAGRLIRTYLQRNDVLEDYMFYFLPNGDTDES